MSAQKPKDSGSNMPWFWVTGLAVVFLVVSLVNFGPQESCSATVQPEEKQAAPTTVPRNAEYHEVYKRVRISGQLLEFEWREGEIPQAARSQLFGLLDTWLDQNPDLEILNAGIEHSKEGAPKRVWLTILLTKESAEKYNAR